MDDEDSQGKEPETEAFSEAFEEEPPRSIFSAIWFRIIVVVVVLGVIAVVAGPYVLDWMSPAPMAPPGERAEAPESASPTGTMTATTPPVAPADSPSPPQAVADSAVAPSPEKTVVEQPQPTQPKTPAPAEQARPKSAQKKASVKAKAPSAAKAVEKPAARAATTQVAAGTGAFWVQVGAFRDPEIAKRLADRLRERKYSVEESVSGDVAAAKATSQAPSRPAGGKGSDLYDIFVSGGSPSDLRARLSAKGLAAEAAPEGAIVKPSLPLRDAVALSKDLAAEGLRVQVKRATPEAPVTPQAPATQAPPDTGGLRRVRVGPYPDRSTANAAVRELEAAGFKPFVVKEGR